MGLGFVRKLTVAPFSSWMCVQDDSSVFRISSSWNPEQINMISRRSCSSVKETINIKDLLFLFAHRHLCVKIVLDKRVEMSHMAVTRVTRSIRFIHLVIIRVVTEQFIFSTRVRIKHLWQIAQLSDGFFSTPCLFPWPDLLQTCAWGHVVCLVITGQSEWGGLTGCLGANVLQSNYTEKERIPKYPKWYHNEKQVMNSENIELFSAQIFILRNWLLI